MTVLQLPQSAQPEGEAKAIPEEARDHSDDRLIG